MNSLIKRYNKFLQEINILNILWYLIVWGILLAINMLILPIDPNYEIGVWILTICGVVLFMVGSFYILDKDDKTMKWVLVSSALFSSTVTYFGCLVFAFLCMLFNYVSFEFVLSILFFLLGSFLFFVPFLFSEIKLIWNKCKLKSVNKRLLKKEKQLEFNSEA